MTTCPSDYGSSFTDLGYIHARGYLSYAALQGVRNQLSCWLTRHGASRNWPWHGIDHQAISVHRTSPLVLEGLQQALSEFDSIYSLALLSHLGTLLRHCTGWPEVSLSPIHNLRAKLPARLGANPFTTVPWHQDYGASDPACARVFLVTTWIPLSPARTFHGGLELIPRSHRLGWLPHRRTNRGPEVDPTAFSEALQQHQDLQPLAIQAMPGDVVLFDQFTLHRSLPNRSNRTRWSLDFRYACAGSSTGRPGLWQRDPCVGEPVDPALMALVRQRCIAMADSATRISKRVDLFGLEG